MAFLAKFAASKYVGDKLEDHFGPEVCISPAPNSHHKPKYVPTDLIY